MTQVLCVVNIVNLEIRIIIFNSNHSYKLSHDPVKTNPKKFIVKKKNNDKICFKVLYLYNCFAIANCKTKIKCFVLFRVIPKLNTA